jgi:hypothetical protein
VSTTSKIAEIAARLAVPNGAGAYTYDLTGDGRVVETEEVVTPPTLPYLTWRLQGIDEDDGPELGDYQRTARLLMVGYVAATADTPTARRTAALNLADDIQTALRADRDLSGFALDVGPTSVDVLRGDAIHLSSQLAVIVVSTMVRWWEDG